ncbi:MAG TPA: hypothetical protein VM936_05085 [Pyrinomonadaceae bacterium]|nr:hypothetical protein [Pyrinomonadaceae bacterium]
MQNVRRALIVLLLLAVAAFAWLWLTRPEKVDMAAYVPADSIVYLEADSLPEVFDGVTSTDAWRELSGAAGVELGRKTSGWLTDLVSFTGLGPSDAVVLSRAQVGVAVLGFEAAEESDTTLRFSPRAAVVAETHTSEWRVRAAVEKLAGDFARRSFGAASVERKEVDGVQFVTWVSQSDARRKVVTAVIESVALMGNDEAAVRACLDVRRGTRPSLAANEQLKEMRTRLGGEGALAFGFAPQGSAAKVVEIFAPAFVGGVSSESKLQSLLATVLPQLTSQILGSAGWSARAAGGGIEDRYFLSLPGDMARRLQAPLTPAPARDGGVASLLPPGTYQLTRYNLRSPEEAWKGLGAALSSQVDVSRATFITLALEALVKPYGVEKPREFLRACGTEIATAKLDPESEGKLLIASVRDREALGAEVRARLGRGARAERVGDAELLISADPDEGAAAFAGEYLLMGSEADVRRCLDAHASGAGGTLQGSPAFRETWKNFSDEQPFARTLTDERESTETVLEYLARRGDGRGAPKQGALEEALARRGYGASETRLADGGFEKRTRSAFGLLGEAVRRF